MHAVAQSVLRWIVAVLACALLVPAAGAADAAIDVGEAQGRQVIGNRVDLLLAQGRDLRLDDLLAGQADAQFFRDPRRVPIFGARSGPYWARIVLRNPEAQPVTAVLVVEFPNFRHMTLHVPGATGYTAKVLDAASHRREVDLDYRYPAFQVRLAAGETQTLFLEIRHYAGRIPLSVWPEREFARFALVEFWVQGVLLGVMVCALVYQLALALLARQREHGSLTACVFFAILVTACMLGYQHVFLGRFGDWLSLLYPAFLMLLAWSIVLFGRQFLRLAVQQPRMNRLLQGVELACLALAALALKRPDWGSQAFVVVLAVGVALIIVSVARQMRRQDPFAWLYLLSLMPLVLSGTLATLTNRGWIPYHDHYHSLVALGFAGGVLMFCFISAYRIGRQRAERRRLAREKQRAEDLAAAQTAFLATVSHEIRTPLNAIGGTLELLRRHSTTDAQRRYIDVARESSEGLLALINQILDFVRLEANAVEVEASDFDPAALLRACFALMEGRAVSARVALDLDLAPDLPAAVHADREKIRQIVLNLLANALKFTAEGRVCLRARHVARDAGWLLIEVADTGIGIEPAAQAKLFERFTQADESIHRRYGGSGLGLAICKALTQTLGGHIGVDSVVGQGSTFRVEIPVAPAKHGVVPALSPAAAAGPEPGAAAHACRHVLLVDDHAINREITAALLVDDGHQVDLAENGREALERLAGGGFDCVLMDLSMPVMDGLETLRALRASPDPALRRMHVVIQTAHALPAKIQACLDAGADAVLTKPLDPRLLRRLLCDAPSPDEDARGEGRPAAGAPAAPTEAVLDVAHYAGNRRLLGADRLIDLLTRQVEDTRAATAAIATQVAAADGPAAAARAHQLAGAAAFLGLPRLRAAAIALEQALLAADAPATERLLSALPRHADDLATELASVRESEPETKPENAPASASEHALPDRLAQTDPAR